MTDGWQTARIGEVAKPIERAEEPQAGTTYRQVGVRLWGQGAYERKPIDGSETQYAKFSRVESGDIIVNKIWARNGSVAVINDEIAGCYRSGEFPTFAPNRNLLEPKWFHWITKAKWFWEACDAKSKGTSGKNRIRPEKFLEIVIPLPPLSEQKHILARIDDIVARISEAQKLRDEIEQENKRMLLAAFLKISNNAPRLPMSEIAPLVRRPVEVDFDQDYFELGVRSFGKGTFHKPALNGSEVGTKKLFYIEPGDLVFSNVFAWEGGIAVAKSVDKGRVGSHRFITCVPMSELATANYLCFYFLTKEGLEKIGLASPGGAGRNRTLGLQALAKIEVPVPNYDKQLWFDGLLHKVNALQELQSQTQEELDALLPSVLDKAFKGEL